MPKNVPAEFVESKTSVWWDMNGCPVPDGYDACRVGPCIKSALEKLGYSGPITIFGFGSIKNTPDHVLQALSSFGIVVKDVPSPSSYMRLMTHLFFWHNKNLGAPATIMLITDNNGVDICSTVLISKQNGRNFLLAYPEPLEKDSGLDTHREWLWKSLLKDAKLKGQEHARLESGLCPDTMVKKQSKKKSRDVTRYEERATISMLRKQPERMAKKRRT